VGDGDRKRQEPISFQGGLKVIRGVKLAEAPLDGDFPGDRGTDIDGVLAVSDCLASWFGQTLRIRRATKEKRGCRAAASCRFNTEAGGNLGGQHVEVIDNANAALPLATLTGRRIGVERYQADHGLPGLGDYDFLAVQGVLDQLGKLRLSPEISLELLKVQLRGGLTLVRICGYDDHYPPRARPPL
jgi:hypothetical protein